MKKRVLSLLLIIVLVFSLAVTTYADFSEDNLYYTIENGSATITGCFGKQEEITVPSMLGGCPVNYIAAGAFVGNDYLKVVYLPDTIMSIAEGAFGSGVTVYMDGVDLLEGEASETAAGSDTSSGEVQDGSSQTPISGSSSAGTSDFQNLEGEAVDELSEIEEETASDETGETEDATSAQGEDSISETTSASNDGSASETASATSGAAQTEASGGGVSPVPFIIGGVVILIIIAVIIIVKKKKK